MANVIKHKRGSGSDPSASDLILGELAIRTDTGKLFTKMDSGAIAEIAGGGSDIAINTLSSSSATGGGSATFNGSAYRFTLSAPPSVSAAQLLVSINGVIQKPVAGTGQPSEGFSVDGTDIILGDAPATGSDFFILTFKSLGVSEPADNSVTSAKIVDGAIVNADINASAAIAGSKINPVSLADVGIGVSSPNVRLHQHIGTSGTNSHRFTNTTTGTGSTDGFILGLSGDEHVLLWNYENTPFRLATNSTERVRVTESGLVGINDSSPRAELSVAAVSGNAPHIDIGQAGSNNFKLGYDSGNCFLGAAASAGQFIFKNNVNSDGHPQASGTERLRIDSSGRLLLGTTTEGTVDSDDLTIATTGNTGMTIRSGTTHNGAIHFSDATSGVGEYAGFIDYDHNTNLFTMGVNSSRFLSADSDLVVAIGKPNFGGASRVVAYGSAGGIDKNSLSVLNPTGTVAGRGSGVAVGGNTDILGSFYAKKSGNADSDGGDVFLESVGAMSFITNGDLTNFTNNTASLVIDSSGNVGIGTASPAYTNALFGGSQRTFHLSGTAAPQLRIQSSTSGQADLLLQAGNSGSTAYIANAASGGDLFFSTNNGGSQGTRFVIKDDGKVGIGTTSPGRTLDVNGIIRSDGTGSALAIGGNSSTPSEGVAIHRPATHTMAFVTDSSERMRIDSGGDVGINESSNINGRLHVQHDALAENILYATRYNQQSTNKPIFAVTEAQMSGFADSGTVIGNHNRSIFIGSVFQDTGVVDTSDTTGLCVRSSGRVGIGTADPNVTLEIKSTTPTIRLSDSDASGTPESEISGGGGDLTFSADRDDENSSTVIDFKTDGTQRMRITSSGIFVPAVHNRTTSASVNMRVDSDGEFRRSTSSKRYKKDITTATWGLAEVLKLKPITYKNNSTEGEIDDKTYGGFTAEDVHDLGLTEFVDYNENNQPDALAYGNMVALMAKAIQELNAKVEALEAK